MDALTVLAGIGIAFSVACLLLYQRSLSRTLERPKVSRDFIDGLKQAGASEELTGKLEASLVKEIKLAKPPRAPLEVMCDPPMFIAPEREHE